MKHLGAWLLLASAALASEPDANKGQAPAPAQEGDLVAVSTWTIDLQSGATKGDGPITLVESEDRDGDGVREVTLKIDLKGHKGVRIRARYGAAPRGWTLNLGDSSTNNGGSGDGATQSHDAEVQVVEGALSVLGSDHTPAKEAKDGVKLLASEGGVGVAGATIELIALDGEARWRAAPNAGTTCVKSAGLFALAGQADNEGPVNHELFVAANRTIGSAWRSGTGLIELTVEVLDAGAGR